MKHFLIFLLLLIPQITFGAEIKISQLPLGSAAAVGTQDSFPYNSATANITKRLTLYDIINIPTMVSTYAPKASPTFTGTVTAPTFVGALTGNASTATALAANPTDCSSGQYANAIAANGNLTCAAVTTSQLSGTLAVASGGTGITSGTSGGILGYTASGVLASSGALTANGLLLGGGAGAVPSVMGSLGTTTTLLHGNAAGAPTFGPVVNADITNGTIDLTAKVTGALPIANGGTNSTATPTTGGVGYGTGTAHAYTAAGSTTQVLHGSASAPTFSAVSLTADVTGTLPFANGGTGLASGTSGGILAFTGTSTITSSALLTSHALILGGGAGVVPYALGSLGTSSTVLHGAAAGDPTFSAVSLTADVSGTLPIANGGTNSTATPTAGGVGYGTGTANAYTAAGAAATYPLFSNTSSAPAFRAIANADLPSQVYVFATASVTSLTNGSSVTIVYPTEVEDASNAYDNTTGIFTVPASSGGLYSVCGNYHSGTSFTSPSEGRQWNISISKNNSDLLKNGNLVPVATTLSDQFYAHICATVRLAAADNIRIRGFQNVNASTAMVLDGDATVNWLTINRLSN